jgi:hypothetical protein
MYICVCIHTHVQDESRIYVSSNSNTTNNTDYENLHFMWIFQIYHMHEYYQDYKILHNFLVVVGFEFRAFIC